MAITVQADQTLDTTGLDCPMPIIWIRNTIKSMPAGETLEVLATDPSVIQNFKAFAGSAGHEMLDWSETRGRVRILIRKGPAA